MNKAAKVQLQEELQGYMIEYHFSRVEPILRDGRVISWVVGLTATKADTGAGAYMDAQVAVATPKPLAEWTLDEILEFCKSRALQTSAFGVPAPEGEETIPGKNWYELLADQIAAQEQAPTPGQPVDLSAKKMRYRGDWEAGEEYLPGDIVKHKVAPESSTARGLFETLERTKEKPSTSEKWKPLKKEK